MQKTTMTREYKSAITRGGGILTPERIVITDNSVTWKKRNNYLIGVDSKTIPIGSISSIEIDQKIWGANITINSFGQGIIIANNFSRSDAKEIKQEIEKLLNGETENH
jgi:hypothetical protein